MTRTRWLKLSEPERKRPEELYVDNLNRLDGHFLLSAAQDSALPHFSALFPLSDMEDEIGRRY